MEEPACLDVSNSNTARKISDLGNESLSASIEPNFPDEDVELGRRRLDDVGAKRDVRSDRTGPIVYEDFVNGVLADETRLMEGGTGDLEVLTGQDNFGAVQCQDDQNGNKLTVRNTEDLDNVSQVTTATQVSTYSKDEVQLARIVGDESLPLEFSFSYIHRPSIIEKDKTRVSFLPGKEVEVKIIDVVPTGNVLHPWLYVIHCKHDKYEWTIKRIHRNFVNMHERLTIFRAETMIPLPTKSSRDFRRTIRQKESRLSLPRFPKRPDVMVQQSQLSERKHQLEKYIRKVVNNPVYRNRPEVCHFFEVCYLSFVNGLGCKSMEGMIKKRAGGQTTPGCCPSVSLKFDPRWFLVKDSFLAYLRPKSKDGSLREVMLFDESFGVDCDEGKCLHITNQNRDLLVHAKNDIIAQHWREAITKMMASKGCDFITKKRFDSFAPIRKNIKAHWFADGRGYMEAIAKTLDQAKEEIFITDWMFSPELQLIRPINDERYRLDNLLIRKANEGVKVFILVYKEFSPAVELASLHVKRHLTRGNRENIKVLRDPDHVPGGTFFWSHHEKLCIIDQTVAFMGGIDLCFGRWDDYQHRLVDLGSITSTPSSQEKAMEVENDDQIKEALLDVFEPEKPEQEKSSIDIARKRKMSYAVSAVGFTLTMVKREPEEKPEEKTLQMDRSELARSRWKRATTVTKAHVAFTSTLRQKDDDNQMYRRPIPSKRRGDKNDSSNSESEDEDTKRPGRFRRTFRRNRRESAPGEKLKRQLMSPSSIEEEARKKGLLDLGILWPGKDYVNFMETDFTDLEKPFEDLVDRRIHPRTPWHDIAAVVTGPAARDLSRHFIQRWNFTKVRMTPSEEGPAHVHKYLFQQFKAKENQKYPLLLPKSYEDVDIPEMFHDFGVSCDIQVLRSVGTWSAGVKETEMSIHDAYIHAIENAKHFIYIENQFFVSLHDSDIVYNGIADALFKRIQKAHENHETFRVYVLLPLIPVPTAVITWVYKSICRDRNSLLARLQPAVGDPAKYIRFFGLRNWGDLCGSLVTQMIYIHSKLLIADDNTVIIGSANLNDRSLLGKRDSELAIYVEDTEFVNSVMDGKPYRAGKFAFNLRKRLFLEHLGLIDKPDPSIDIRDPVCHHFWYNIWCRAAKTNTSVYDDVFKVFFTDYVTTINDLKDYSSNVHKLSKMDPEKAMEILTTDLRGTLVNIPLKFLEKADMSVNIGTKELLVPDVIWT